MIIDVIVDPDYDYALQIDDGRIVISVPISYDDLKRLDWAIHKAVGKQYVLD